MSLPLYALLLSPGFAADAAPGLPAPDPRGALVRDRAFDMQTLDLELEIDPVKHTVAGRATWAVSRLSPGDLRLDAVAFRDVRATVDGKEAVVRPGERELIVTMPDGSPGSAHTVVVAYAATPQLGLHWRGPAGAGGGPDSPDTYTEVHSQGELEENRYWFPSYDHPDDRFAYTGRFTVAGSPPGWTVVTNSGPDLPSYLVMLAAAPYDVVAGPAGNIPTRAFVPPGTPEAWVRPVLDPLPDMFAWFAERTGVPYAWERYDQTFVQRFIYGGMENTGSTIETRRMLSPPSVRATRSWIPSIVAHELAHQWYGDLLTAHTNREMWLNEGFATFFAADWEVHARRVTEGDAAADALAAAQIDGWRRASLDSGGLAGRWFLGGLGNHNVYNKGASTLTGLRRLLGEEVFWAGIRDYTRTHAHSSVDTLELQRAMEARSGRDLGWFFQQWTELPGVPRVQTSWAWESDPAGGGTLTVQLTQSARPDTPAAPPYTLPVDIVADGAPPIRAWLTGPALTVTTRTPTAPRWVEIDPGGALLVDWDQHQAPEAWAHQLEHGSPYSRLLAVRALADQPAASPDPLAEAFTDPATPELLRETLADALGTRRTCATLWPAAETDGDERIRAAAAAALGKCATRDPVPAMLTRLAREPNSDVRAALLRSASTLDPAGTLPTARRELSRSDALEGERSAAAAAIGLAGTPADVPALLRTPADRDLRLTGLRAAVLVVQRQPLGPERERLRAVVARSAERLLADVDLRGLQGGLSALRDVGDAHSVALVEALVRASTVPEVVSQARDTVTAIQGRVDSVVQPTPNEAAARLEALEKRIKSLEAAAGTDKH